MRDLALVGWALLLPTAGFAGAAKAPVCSKDFACGRETRRRDRSGRRSSGRDWVFRLVPVQRGTAGYSGWDLVVDRDPSAGYPDALLVATPPYCTPSAEREVERFQRLDCRAAGMQIGWNPRSFHFLTDPRCAPRKPEAVSEPWEEQKSGRRSLHKAARSKLLSSDCWK